MLLQGEMAVLNNQRKSFLHIQCYLFIVLNQKSQFNNIASVVNFFKCGFILYCFSEHYLIFPVFFVLSLAFKTVVILLQDNDAKDQSLKRFSKYSRFEHI